MEDLNQPGKKPNKREYTNQLIDHIASVCMMELNLSMKNLKLFILKNQILYYIYRIIRKRIYME